MADKLADLERLFDRFQQLKFPVANGPELRNLHAMLALYVADVAAAVTKVLRTRHLSPDLHRLSGLQEDQQIEAGIQGLLAKHSSSDGVSRIVQEYLEYLTSIKMLLQAAHSYIDALSP